MSDDSGNKVQSVEKSLKLIEILQQHDQLGVTEVAEELNMTKASAYSHLSTLRDEGFVIKKDGKYQLGLKFIEIAHDLRRREEIFDIVEKEVENIAENSGELALFTMEEQHEGICMYIASGSKAVETELHVGYRNELYHTAVGKAILAFKPQDEIEKFIQETELRALTKNTITDPDELREELREIREEGIAYNRGETIPGLTGIGAPIQMLDDEVSGAISVVGPSSRMTEKWLDEISDMINQSVNVIEINATSI
jgi:DNA-binding IclR family transcriptional regulator